MHPIVVLGAAVVAASASSFAIVQTLTPAPPVPVLDPDGAKARCDDLADQNAALRAEIVSLRERVQALEGRRTPVATATEEQVRRIVAEMTASRHEPVEAITEPLALDPDVVFAQLTGDALDWDRAEVIWKQVRDAGLIDQMVAKFEQMAEAQPAVADAQAALGNAYLQKLFTVGPIEQGPIAIKADKAFDAALALDEQHWKARFSKAVSLSHWPAFLGRGPEAMRQFEVLIDQQELQASRGGQFAQPYLFLGNMYAQRGDGDKAREVWQRGLRNHPDDAALREKLGQ